MQFKAVLLVACGWKNWEVAKFLGTTEPVIRNVLKDIYKRTDCRNSGELVRQYFREVESGVLELSRLRRELAELEARAARNLHARLEDRLRSYAYPNRLIPAASSLRGEEQPPLKRPD